MKDLNAQRSRRGRQDHRRLRPLDGPGSGGEDHAKAGQAQTKSARRPRSPRSCYALDEAIEAGQGATPTPSSTRPIEIAINLGVDPRHADQQVRGVVSLPSGTGRDVRVAVFAKDAKADEASAAGADIVGAEDLFEKIKGGFIDFDRVSPRRT